MKLVLSIFAAALIASACTKKEAAPTPEAAPAAPAQEAAPVDASGSTTTTTL